jgi:large subunit ribosomal protein L6
MSRIGKAPITLPAKVEVSVASNNVVTVKGPKGTLTQRVDPDITVEMDGGIVVVKRPTDSKRHRSMHGLYRALIQNLVTGVSTGYTSTLEIFGVGYRVESQGQQVTFTLGYSHPIIFTIPAEVKVETKMDKGAPPTIILSSIDKELLGQVCSRVRAFRKAEPYKGKGILFKGEVIRRKAGKTGGKGGKK